MTAHLLPEPAGATSLAFDSAGTRCHAWHFAAAGGDPGGRPVAVLAHGFGGTKDSGLEAFARAYVAAGIDVLAFDFRCLGASEGTPRQRVRMREQIADYRSAVRTAATLPGVDPARIVLWGVSMSGGHALAVAAELAAAGGPPPQGVAAGAALSGGAAGAGSSAAGAAGRGAPAAGNRGPGSGAGGVVRPGVAAVVALTPLVDGLAAARHAVAHGGGAAALRGAVGGARAGLARLRGRDALVPLVGPPGSGAALSLDGYEKSYRALAGPTWRNGIDPAVLAELPRYRPIRRAAAITAPVLVQIADFDRAAPPYPAAKAAFAARAEVRHYPCDHFDVWPGGAFHESAVEHQLLFLRRHLAR